MKKYKVIAIVQIYNELRKENLERFIKHILPLVDALIIYDDASTDGSYEYVKRYTPYVIKGKKNDFTNERTHRQQLLDAALKLKPDFILWLDADEVLTANAREMLQKIAHECVQKNLDGISLHEINLWRSASWQRIDNLYDDGWFVRLWRVTPQLAYTSTKRGLHQQMYPETIQKIEKTKDLSVLHYGFASDKNIIFKYLTYQKHGQAGPLLLRLIDERTLELIPVNPSLFPTDLYQESEKPLPRPLYEWYAVLEVQRDKILQPEISIVCLVYKSTKWLQFVYDQILRHTDLSNKEFFFVANDANENIQNYLKNHYIPHYIFNNTEEHKKEWYINNVYRAFNFGAHVAKGEYVLFINSDMAFSTNWVENMFEEMNGKNCIASRLVESGKMPSGRHGISKNFGQFREQYDEQGFLNYADTIRENAIIDGGLFMPLLIRRDDFLSVGGYPEGNIIPNSDIFNPKYAKPGDSLISGDFVLMQRLKTRGIQHQTCFNSVVYHFQEGELDDVADKKTNQTDAGIIIANDYLTGRMGEKTMWNHLIEKLPNTAPLDKTMLPETPYFEDEGRKYIAKHYTRAKFIIQNATFINLISPDHFTIIYLQDDLRSMGRFSRQQEENLRLADFRVTNSNLTASSYPEYEFEKIPIGINEALFSPGNKRIEREKYGIPKNKQVGIFVGDLSEVKGWAKVRNIIENHPEILWIVVSKDDKKYEAPNVKMFNRISQEILATLHRAADFFILGSSVETQCLAAIEACFTNIPVIMRTVGIFSDFSEEDREQCGIFGEDFEKALQKIPTKTFSPRAVMIKNKLHIEGMIDQWKNLLTRLHQRIAAEKATQNISLTPKKRPIRFGRKRANERWLSQEHIRRELFYLLPPFLFKIIFGAWRWLMEFLYWLRNGEKKA
ncbi:hypothetical protein A3J20_01925 [Candidatus Gottesmanbacteria bacterium RIFCSPLOWO2_02_FULL_42_29]|nr:MAG: hypothetical protein A3J20_01925 [Candidatus Gottesmanbacteria bacterium RIFCSPLOWO2_02_FULL_42_29]